MVAPSADVRVGSPILCAVMHPDDQRARFLAEARSGRHLPFPGHGRTYERFVGLQQGAQEDGGLGRLLEAHEDALAILDEAGHLGARGQALAVWASEGDHPLELQKVPGGYQLWGKKRFCGGADVVDAAVVTVPGVQGSQLVLVPLDSPAVHVDMSTWQTPAFQSAAVGTVTFSGLHLSHEAAVGGPGFYTSRPGFWQGAVGVAAVWAGLTDALIASLARSRPRTDQIGLACSGELEANRWAIDTALRQAAFGIDASPTSDCERVALCCRQIVRVHSESILRTLLHESGPVGLAFHPSAGTQVLELTMALGQSHGARDLVALGERVRKDEHSRQSMIGGGGGNGTGSVG